MSYDYDYIDQLIAEDIAGVISASDKQILAKAIAEHRALYHLWDKRRRRFQSKETRLWLKTGIVPPKKMRIPAKMLLYISGIGIAVIILFAVTHHKWQFDKVIPVKQGQDSTSKKQLP